MASLINPEDADRFKLDIWREIMHANGGGNPTASATKAVEAFNALYPDPPKAKSRNASAAKPLAKARR